VFHTVLDPKLHMNYGTKPSTRLKLNFH
ncbi:uncharacterized protein METZ01_LOCUS186188, partial [marine metagenome]